MKLNNRFLFIVLIIVIICSLQFAVAGDVNSTDTVSMASVDADMDLHNNNDNNFESSSELLSQYHELDGGSNDEKNRREIKWQIIREITEIILMMIT